MRIKNAFRIIVLTICISSSAQKSDIKFGLKAPLTYSMGYEYKFSDIIGISFHSNILTVPFEKTILNILKIFDTDDILLNTIGEAFSYGFEFQPGFNLWLKKYYLGINYSYFVLIANESPADAIENYYGIAIPDRITSHVPELKLKSQLHNAGIIIGRKISLKNQKIGLRTEIQLLKCFASKSQLSGENGIYPRLSNAIDDELDTYYIQYGYIPSINIYFTYKTR